MSECDADLCHRNASSNSIFKKSVQKWSLSVEIAAVKLFKPSLQGPHSLLGQIQMENPHSRVVCPGCTSLHVENEIPYDYANLGMICRIQDRKPNKTESSQKTAVNQKQKSKMGKEKKGVGPTKTTTISCNTKNQRFICRLRPYRLLLRKVLSKSSRGLEVGG